MFHSSLWYNTLHMHIKSVIIMNNNVKLAVASGGVYERKSRWDLSVLWGESNDIKETFIRRVMDERILKYIKESD